MGGVRHCTGASLPVAGGGLGACQEGVASRGTGSCDRTCPCVSAATACHAGTPVSLARLRSGNGSRRWGNEAAAMSSSRRAGANSRAAVATRRPRAAGTTGVGRPGRAPASLRSSRCEWRSEGPPMVSAAGQPSWAVAGLRTLSVRSCSMAALPSDLAAPVRGGAGVGRDVGAPPRDSG